MLTLIAWIAFIILEQKNKPKSHEKVCKNKGFCGIAMPSENDNILTNPNKSLATKVD